MTAEELTSQLKTILGPELQAVVLYGSAAAGDHAGKRSDLNVLVVLSRLGVRELRAMGAPLRDWTRAGNRPPMLFTTEQLRRSMDVFPIEFFDIRDAHRVLYGENPLHGLDIPLPALRLQLEHDLKVRLIQLRERYLLAGGKPAAVALLLTDSISSVLSLLKATLRLFGSEVPARKLDAAKALAAHLKFNADAFAAVQELKEGKRHLRDVDVERLFEHYLTTLEDIVHAVDKHLPRGS